MAEKENDSVATGILPVVPNRQAGSLSHQPISSVGCHCWLVQQCFLSSFSKVVPEWSRTAGQASSGTHMTILDYFGELL
jgi:hypothetical protein